jgi:hypothetical protein
MEKSLNFFEEYRKTQAIKNADGLFYAIISSLFAFASFIAFLYMQYIVFEVQFGIVGTIALAVFTFLVPGTVFNYIKKNNRDTVKRHIVLSIVKFVCTTLYAYIYYIVLSKYIPSNILIYFLVGTSVVSYIFYIIKFETMTIFVESIKSTFIEICLSYVLFTLVDIKIFILIVGMIYLPTYISSSVKSALKVSEK